MNIQEICKKYGISDNYLNSKDDAHQVAAASASFFLSTLLAGTKILWDVVSIRGGLNSAGTMCFEFQSFEINTTLSYLPSLCREKVLLKVGLPIEICSEVPWPRFITKNFYF